MPKLFFTWESIQNKAGIGRYFQIAICHKLMRSNQHVYSYALSYFQAAADILHNMDESVNPCDDFYQFACGNFIRKTAIPDDRTRVSSFSVLSDELLSQVKYFRMNFKI